MTNSTSKALVHEKRSAFNLCMNKDEFSRLKDTVLIILTALKMHENLYSSHTVKEDFHG